MENKKLTDSLYYCFIAYVTLIVLNNVLALEYMSKLPFDQKYMLGVKVVEVIWFGVMQNYWRKSEQSVLGYNMLMMVGLMFVFQGWFLYEGLDRYSEIVRNETVQWLYRLSYLGIWVGILMWGLMVEGGGALKALMAGSVLPLTANELYYILIAPHVYMNVYTKKANEITEYTLYGVALASAVWLIFTIAFAWAARQSGSQENR